MLEVGLLENLFSIHCLRIWALKRLCQMRSFNCVSKSWVQWIIFIAYFAYGIVFTATENVLEKCLYIIFRIQGWSETQKSINVNTSLSKIILLWLQIVIKLGIKDDIQNVKC